MLGSDGQDEVLGEMSDGAITHQMPATGLQHSGSDTIKTKHTDISHVRVKLAMHSRITEMLAAEKRKMKRSWRREHN